MAMVGDAASPAKLQIKKRYIVVYLLLRIASGDLLIYRISRGRSQADIWKAWE